MAEMVVNDAKVMAKGQVTIPKNIRAILGVNSGDRVRNDIKINETFSHARLSVNCCSL